MKHLTVLIVDIRIIKHSEPEDLIRREFAILDFLRRFPVSRKYVFNNAINKIIIKLI